MQVKSWIYFCLLFKLPVFMLSRFCHFWPLYVDIFYLIRVDKKSTFLDYLPTFSCQCRMGIHQYIHCAFFENASIWSWKLTLNRIQRLAKGANMNVNELLYTRTFSFVCPLSKELWVRNSPEGNFWPTFSIWTTVGTQVIISLDNVSVNGKISSWTQNLITGDYF